MDLFDRGDFDQGFSNSNVFSQDKPATMADQEKGKPIQILRKVDSVKCPPDTGHWHGASPEVGFVQIAVTPNTARGRSPGYGP